MESDDNRCLDVLGIKPISDSIKKVTDATIDGAASFLSRICLPAAEEFGLLLRDRVRYWRALNIAKLAAKTEEKLKTQGITGNIQAHPRMVFQIVEECSWVDDDHLQGMWAGLLASSCSKEGVDDSNQIFIEILSKITALQAEIINYACKNAEKRVTTNGLLVAKDLCVNVSEIHKITGESDILRLDREIDYLRSRDILRGTLDAGGSSNANISPSPLCLHMFARCQGFRGNPIEFYRQDIEKQEKASSDKPMLDKSE